MKKLIVAVVIVVTMATSSYASFSGNELMDGLQQKQALYMSGMSDGYISAISDVLQVRGKICIPGKVTLGQTKDVVAKYLKDNPAERHRTAMKLVTFVLMDTWPCKEEVK